MSLDATNNTNFIAADNEDEENVASPQIVQPNNSQKRSSSRNSRSNSNSRMNSASPPHDIIPHWTLDDFEFGKKIGEGRFSVVYLAREKSTGYKVAIKAVRKDDVIRLDMRHQLEREVRIQKYASRHSNILSMYAYFWDQKFVYLVTEYAEGGDMAQFFSLSSSATTTQQQQQQQQNSNSNNKSNSNNNQQQAVVDEATVACWSKQLLEAVAFLHQHRILHRDIKPDNLLLKRGVLKLADFTWAVSLGDDPPFDRRRTICGTLDYLSPELVSHMPYDTQLDVWSIGVVVFELLVGSPPFEHPRPVDTCLCIQRGEFSIPENSMSDFAQDFLKSVLVVEPSERPSCKELLKHPWIETVASESTSFLDSLRRRGRSHHSSTSRKSKSKSRGRSKSRENNNNNTNNTASSSSNNNNNTTTYNTTLNSGSGGSGSDTMMNNNQTTNSRTDSYRSGDSLLHNNNNNNQDLSSVTLPGNDSDINNTNQSAISNRPHTNVEIDVSRALELSGIAGGESSLEDPSMMN